MISAQAVLQFLHISTVSWYGIFELTGVVASAGLGYPDHLADLVCLQVHAMMLVLGLPDNAQSVHFNKNDEALAKKQPRLKNACKVAKAAAEELMQQKQAKSLHPRAAAVVSTVERMVTADTKSEIDCQVCDSNQQTYC